MKYVVEMGSGVIIYILIFITIDSGIQRLTEGTHRQHGDRTSLILLLFFFKIRKVG
jgi:hypothetical protein